MTLRVYTNVAVTTELTSAIDDNDTTIPVVSTSGWVDPGAGEVAVAMIDGGLATVEVITYTGLTGTTLTGVVRGVDGTTAQSHLIAAAVDHAVSAADMNRISSGSDGEVYGIVAGTAGMFEPEELELMREEDGTAIWAVLGAHSDALEDGAANLTAHIDDAVGAHAATAIANTPAGGIAATTVQAALNELDTEKATAASLTAHIDDTTAAHAATAISNAPAGNIAATTVQAAIDELDSEKASAASVSDHLADTSAAHAASAISNTPAGSIAATDVQAAITELDSDITAHTGDATAAHAATAISFAPAGTIAATDAQAAIEEVASEAATALTAHTGDATDAHAGTAITNTPAGSIAATTVQAAINELDGDITAHVSDSSAAHAASAISFSATGSIAATDVQAAVAEVASEAATALTTHESDTSTHGVATVAGLTEAQTFTSKRIQPRSSTSASGDISPDLATATIYQRTAQAAALDIANPIGTPVLGESIMATVLDNGTPRAITMGNAYVGMGQALPTTTTANKRIDISMQYDGASGKWRTYWSVEV
jgi:hypothetical protein